MENANFIFSSGPVELKEEGENFYVEGHISTSDLDLVNDIVTQECIIDMTDQMKERTIKLDVEHESFRGETELEREINKTIIPAAKIDDFLVDKKGLKVRAVLNKHIQRFNEVKNSIKEGFLDAFSIAFIPVKSKIEMREGHEVRRLDKINLLNVAFTGNPVNTHTTMTNVLAKSLEFLKDQEKAKPKKPPKRTVPDSEYEEDEEEDKKKEKKNHDHASDNLNKLEEVKKMTEEDKEKEKLGGEEPGEKEEPEKPEEPEKKDEPEKPEEPEEPEKKDEPEEPEDPEKPGEEDKSKIAKLEKDMTEVKAVLKRPLLKSRIEQVNKTGIKEEKSLNPLDVIA